MRTAFVLASTLLVALSTAQEPVDPEQKAPAESPATAAERMQQLEELQRKAIDDWREANKKAQEEAKDAKPGEPAKAMSMRPDFGPIVAKASAFAAEFAGKDDAVPFLMFVVQNGVEKDARRGALETLLTAHIDSSELAALGSMMPYIGQMVDEEFAESAMARLLESGNVNVRGWALFAKHKGDIETADRDGEQYGLAKQTLLKAAEASDDKRLASEIRSAIDLREKFGAGNIAPDIVGVDLDGVDFKLSDYKGKVIFLDFWGDW